MNLTTRFAGALAASLAGLLLFAAAPVLASGQGGTLPQTPQWTVTSVSRPTNFNPSAPSGKDSYQVTVTNTGGASTDGSAITITDELPQGLSLDPAGVSGEDALAVTHGSPPGANFNCVLRTCTYSAPVVPDDTLILSFPVDVSAGAPSSLTNVVRVSGGGAPDAAMQTPTVISEAPASFGISLGGATTSLSSLQAGAHPDLTTSVAFNTVDSFGDLAGDPKDTVDDVPPGFVLDLRDAPSCPPAKFAMGECPIATQVGVTAIALKELGTVPTHELQPVYNLSPNSGEVAKIGFPVAGLFDVQGGITLRPGDYGGRATFSNVNESLAELDNVSLTLWGVPADPIHDPLRALPGGTLTNDFGHPSDAARAPFFTNATSCGSEPLNAIFTVDSWQEPQHSVTAPMLFGPLVGCDRLSLEPSLTAEVSSNSAYAPTGFDLATKIPQTYDNPDGLATSALKKEVVTLPEGMTVNPSAGAGLAACTPAQFAEEALQYMAGRGCPNQSKLATVKITTPALSEEVTGSVFLAQPAPFGETGHNPFNSLLALYLVARIPDRGVLIRSPGEVEPNLQTGQLVTTFDNLPPLPFGLATFSFNQGANAPLVTPPVCGSYTVKAELTPYSNPEAAPLSPLIPPFTISSGVGGGACPGGGVPPFAPSVSAGTQNNNGGSYSPLYIRISRNDGEQEITGFASAFPPGLTGNLSGIPFCGEAEIQAAKAQTGAQTEVHPACPAASQIGRTIAEAGVGGVLAQTPGKLYLDGPFEGAPFSVVSVTSAKVGPFDLGTVVVHLPLHIDPLTAAVSIPSGPAEQIPHIIKGIVIHLRTIRVYIDREHFMINPTSCDPMGLSATVIGGGADPTNPAANNPVTVNEPFQAADCASLAFKPSFKATVTGKNSKVGGAALKVNIAYPNTPQGTEANIHSVKVELPRQLPSRLTTLQKACLAKVFEANPARCPPASIVGQAKAVTPILPVPLTGPAYFVSYGGAKFPELVMVLQGYGVTIVLHGETFIDKHGITSSTFHQVPDQPVSSFELTLPQGRYSALAANGNLCALTRTTTKKTVTRRIHRHSKRVKVSVKHTVPASLIMPTEMIAQNGAERHQSTPIEVTGCPKAVRHERKKNHRKKKKK